MQIILLVAGLIFLLAVTAPWAATVGWICLAVFAFITAIQIAFLAFAVNAQNNMRSNFGRRF